MSFLRNEWHVKHKNESGVFLEKISLTERIKLNSVSWLYGGYYLCEMMLWVLWQRLSKRGALRSNEVDAEPIKLIDRSPGEHCYVRIKGVKYHYVEAKLAEWERCDGSVVLVGGAPCGWGAAEAWTTIADLLVSHKIRVIIIDPADEAFVEAEDLPSMLQRIRAVLDAAGVCRSTNISSGKTGPVRIAGIGLGALVAWYLALLNDEIFDGVALVGAPHPNLFWENLPPKGTLNSSWMYFILAGGWRWAEQYLKVTGSERGCEEVGDREALTVRGSMAAWRSASRWWNGAACWRLNPTPLLKTPALLVAQAGSETALLSSGELCSRPALRMLPHLHPALPDRCKGLQPLLIHFLADGKEPAKKVNGVAKNGRVSSVTNVMGRMLGAVTGSVGAVTSSVRSVATAT